MEPTEKPKQSPMIAHKELNKDGAKVLLLLITAISAWIPEVL